MSNERRRRRDRDDGPAIREGRGDKKNSGGGVNSAGGIAPLYSGEGMGGGRGPVIYFVAGTDLFSTAQNCIVWAEKLIGGRKL